MEVRTPKEVFTELREVKSPGDRTPKERAAFPKLSGGKDAEETATPGTRKQEEGFRMIKGGKGYTIADIEALPEGERAELIDGELFRMDAPLRIHQKLLAKIFYKIMSYIEKNNGKCEVYPAPFAVCIKKDDYNYVEPDISVICDRDKLDRKGCQGAPDWVIEILSPSSVKMDCERKVKLYRETGVREYWIVDSEKKMVAVYGLGQSETPQGTCAVYGLGQSEAPQGTCAVYGFGQSEKPQGTGTQTNGTCALAEKPWDEPVYYSFSERIKVGIFEDLWLDFEEMDLR